jgi:hypothetical protein
MGEAGLCRLLLMEVSMGKKRQQLAQKPQPGIWASAKKIMKEVTNDVLWTVNWFRDGFGEFSQITDQANRELESEIRQASWLENLMRLRYVEGLLEQMGGIRIENNSILSKGWTFKVAKFDEIPESRQYLNWLYEAGCPMQRLDIGVLGSKAQSKEYDLWVRNRIKESDFVPKGWLEHHKKAIDTVSESERTYKSYLVYPLELVPPKLREQLNELSDFYLWEYLAGLFHPFSEFNPKALLEKITDLTSGKPPLATIAPETLVRNDWGIESGGRVFLKFLRILGLGLSEEHPFIRSVDELRDLVLPAIQEHREEIRITTTIWGVQEAKRRSFEQYESNEMGKFGEKRAEQQEIEAREKALELIYTDQVFMPFHETVIMAMKAESKSKTNDLYDRVLDLLSYNDVLYEKVTDPFENWDNFLAFLPDIRTREVKKETMPRPAPAAGKIFRRKQSRIQRFGALLGYYLPFGEPLILELGGNYFAFGAPGSGKSMFVKYLAWRLIPLSNKWVFRFMDNTNVRLDNPRLLRGMKNLVEDSGGRVISAADPKFENNPKELRRELEKIWADNIRVVLFHSTEAQTELDLVWLEWWEDDIEISPQGLYVVDETANWFVHKNDERARLWVYRLLGQLAKHSKMSVTTIQSPGIIRVEQPGVWEQLQSTIIGKFVFWTPNIESLPEDIGIPSLYPNLRQWVIDRVSSFKYDERGPLQRPGFTVYAATGTGGGVVAQEAKIEIDLETLQRLARKDVTKIQEDELWSL